MERKGAPIDIKKAVDIVDGDKTLFTELLDIFFEGFPEQERKIILAIKNGDAGTIRYFAHQVKGGLRNFAAERACDAAYELEKTGETGDLDGSGSQLDTLKREIAAVQEYVDDGGWESEFREEIEDRETKQTQ